jgi:UDP-glucose:(heptosyl)LPS alpha-1,3-glucosyltransferase
MKLAFCLFKYYPYGGLERDFIRIISACQQHGHEIEIFTMHWNGTVPNGIHVNIVPAKGQTNHQRCANFVKNLSNVLKPAQYSAVIGFNRMPGLDLYYAADVCYACRLNIKRNWLYKLTPRYKIYAAFEQAVFAPESKTQIMYLAPMVKQQYIKHYHTQESRFHQISPGIALDRAHPVSIEQTRTKIRNKYNLNTNTKLILQIGSNFKLKGVDRSLFAIASLPKNIRNHVEYWVVGKGKTIKYKYLSRALNIFANVRFIGTSDNIPELLLAADLLIHPSRREAAGLVLVESIVAGLPVLTTVSCGFAYHVEQANAGIVVPNPYEQINLNKILLTMLTNEKQLKAWHKNGLAYGKKEDLYSREDAVKIIEEIAAKNSKLR